MLIIISSSPFPETLLRTDRQVWWCGDDSLGASTPPISILNTTSARGEQRCMDIIGAEEGVVIQTPPIVFLALIDMTSHLHIAAET